MVSDIVRVQGCANHNNIIGMLFDEEVSESIITLRIKTCPNKYESACNMNDCSRYRIGTKGSTRVSWDNKGKRL